MLKYLFLSVTVISLLGIVGIIAGCAVKQEPTAQEIQTEVLPQTTTVPEQFSAAQDNGKVDSGWIDSFSDSQLNALVAEALQNNLNLQVAQAQVERASALSVLAGAALKPTVGYGVEASQSNIGNEQLAALAGDSMRYNAGLAISWEADVWGRVRTGVAAAEAALQATQADYEFARQSLVASVAKAWFICIEAKLQFSFAEEVVTLMEKTLNVVTTKQEVGQIPMQDVHLAKANLASAKNSLEQTVLAMERSQRGLETLLGRYPAADIETANQLPEHPGDLPAGLPSELLERRPDLQAAERRVAAAFNLTQQAELAKLPRFSLTASGAFNNLTDTIATLGAGIVGPLYTGGALEAQVDIATADQKAAMAQYGQKALTAFQEVENGLSSEDTLQKQNSYLENIEGDYRKSMELVMDEYEVGKVDLLSVLVIQGQWVGSNISLINIQNQRLLQRVDLHLALGGSFSEPTE